MNNMGITVASYVKGLEIVSSPAVDMYDQVGLISFLGTP